MMKRTLYSAITLFAFIFLLPAQGEAQEAVKYLCNELNGEVEGKVESRSFADKAYKCKVEEQQDLLILDGINSLFVDNNMLEWSTQGWNVVSVGEVKYSRSKIIYKSVDYPELTIHVPYKQKTGKLFIAN